MIQPPGFPAALEVTIRKDWVERHDGGGLRTCVLTLKENDFGLWQCVWPEGSVSSDVLGSALVSGEDLGRWGVVFRNPGVEKPIASGPVTTIIQSEGVVEGVAQNALSAWGVTDLTHLRERIVFPDHTVDLPDSNVTGTSGTWPTFRDVRTGVAETLLIDYVQRNLGSGAIARRQLGANYPCTLIAPASQGRGPVVTVDPPANRNVLEQAFELAALADLVFDIVQTGPAELTMVVRERQVRRNVIFDVAAGTALGVQVKAQRRPKTSVIASGSGQDDPATVYVRREARAPSPAAEPTGGYSEVREEFIKGSGEDAAPLILKADAELIDDGPETGLKVEPAPGVPWRVGAEYDALGNYVRGYDLGDSVIGVIRGTPFEAPIRQVLLRHEDGTLVEEPSVGFGEFESIEPVLDHLFSRIRRLEDRA